MVCWTLSSKAEFKKATIALQQLAFSLQRSTHEMALSKPKTNICILTILKYKGKYNNNHKKDGTGRGWLPMLPMFRANLWLRTVEIELLSYGLKKIAIKSDARGCSLVALSLIRELVCIWIHNHCQKVIQYTYEMMGSLLFTVLEKLEQHRATGMHLFTSCCFLVPWGGRILYTH